MELWLDTIDLETIGQAAEMGLIRGVTTNPAIVSEAPRLEGLLQKLLDAQPGPVCVQVTAQETEGMVQEAMQLHRYSKRLIIKVPVNQAGLLATHRLVRSGVQVLATAILQSRQLLLAAQVGAHYAAPYIGHMEGDGLVELHRMQEMMDGYSTKILAASLKTVDQLVQCARLQIAAATIKASLFAELIADHPRSQEFTAKFNALWQRSFPGANAAQLTS